MNVNIIRGRLVNGGQAIMGDQAHTCLAEAESLINLVLAYTPRRGPDHDDVFTLKLRAARDAVYETKLHAALKKNTVVTT